MIPPDLRQNIFLCSRVGTGRVPGPAEFRGGIRTEQTRNRPDISRRIRIYGIVQGVGFRPAAVRCARARGVRGTVRNCGSFVEIAAQGTEDAVNGFVREMTEHPPDRADVVRTEVCDMPESPRYEDFSIAESTGKGGMIFIPPDIAVCADCARELFDRGNRRYLHPFINCTQCGPRLTILESLPYDRERTSMKDFPMCPACEHEYRDPNSRRFDAQPVCCSDCGPSLYLLGTDIRGREAITRTRKMLSEGKIAAVKGIGGFHLACDASDAQAVARLRKLKHRPVKPFAVMMRSMDAVRRECRLTPEKEAVLTGHQKPILLLEKTGAGLLAEEVAPGNPSVGVMLPYAPLQLLLFDYDDGISMPDMLVMTSGNVSGAPICRSDEEAEEQIAGFCDCILSHNRNILTRADDSVMDFFEDKPYMIRRSRGYSPLPFLLSGGYRGKVLAVGGELKNTFCIGIDSLFYPSSYIGDLSDPRSGAALKETIGRYEAFLGVKPEAVACDLHPGYQSTEIAESFGLPLVRVQHHYAHILSCMAENDCPGPVIGVSFDGTGYGADGTVWGGEILCADCHGFQRLGHIAPFPHTGGDAASREGWRVAASMLAVCGGKNFGAAFSDAQALELSSAPAVRAQLRATECGVNTIRSTSAGRLFDAVSAVLGVCRASTFEGEASCALEYAAEAWRKSHPDEAARLAGEAACGVRREGDVLVMETDLLFRQIADARLSGGDAGSLSYLFHARLADAVCAAVSAAGEQTGIRTAALSGGVFQNRLLLELAVPALRKSGFRVLLHSLTPPNDGGIALGQAVYAMANRQG